MFEIEKNIEIPNKNYPKFPLSQMEVNDSFFIECKKEDIIKTRNRVQAAGYRESNAKFVCRVAPGGLRIWRIK